MTHQQITWAAEHDWFIRAIDGGVVVREVYSIGTGKPFYEGVTTFRNFANLKAWAGY